MSFLHGALRTIAVVGAQFPVLSLFLVHSTFAQVYINIYKTLPNCDDDDDDDVILFIYLL